MRRLTAVLVVSIAMIFATGFASQASASHGWSGTSAGCRWVRVASPNVSTDSLFDVSGSSSVDVWAVGYRLVHAGSRGLIEHWGSSSWTLVREADTSDAFQLLYGVTALSPTDAWAVGTGSGTTLTQHWDGTAWTVVPSPNVAGSTNVLNGVSAIATDDVWAVGSAGKTPLTLHWNGAAWNIVAAPKAGRVANRLSSVAATSANDVWAVGDFSTAPGTTQPLIEHWDGAHWSIASADSAPTPAGLSGVAVVGANDVWAVGSSAKATLTEHWDGVHWSVVPSPSVAANDNALLAVAAISSDDVWAGGGTAAPGGPATALFEQWDGSMWQIARTHPQRSSYLYGIISFGTHDVWGVGSASAGETLTMHYC